MRQGRWWHRRQLHLQRRRREVLPSPLELCNGGPDAVDACLYHLSATADLLNKKAREAVGAGVVQEQRRFALLVLMLRLVQLLPELVDLLLGRSGGQGMSPAKSDEEAQGMRVRCSSEEELTGTQGGARQRADKKQSAGWVDGAGNQRGK